MEDFLSNVKHLKSPQFFSQLKLNDLVYDLGLSKQAANLLTFQLNKKNLDRSAKVSHFKTREQIFVNVYSEVDSFVFFHDISDLRSNIDISIHNSTDWKMFVNSSK